MRTTRILAFLVAVLSACGIDKPIDVAESMPLRKQPVTVLLQGLNQKAPGTVGVLGQLEVAENIRIQKGTAAGVELVRRNGLTEIADVTWVDSAFIGARRMVGRDGVIFVQSTGGTPMQRYTPQSGGSFNFTDTADHGLIGVQRSDLQVPIKAVAGAQTPTQASLDSVFIGDLGCRVWYDQDGAVQFVVGDARGTVLANNTIVASGATNTKIVALGTSWYVFWKEANAIRAAAISSGTYAAGAATTVVAAASCLAGTDYDIQAGFGASIALMYRIDATHHGRALVSTAFVVSGLISDATAADQPDIAMCWLTQVSYLGSLYYATLNAANGLKIQTINATTLAITATITNAAAPVTTVRNIDRKSVV